jgi:hypothetical protein
VRAPGAGYMALYNLGAEHARGEWIVLTESHVLAEPGCLAAVADGIDAAPDLEAAQLVADHVRPTRFAHLLAEWFEDVFARWEHPGEWKRLGFFGAAVRRETYLAVSEVVNDDHELFSFYMLSATLDAQGARVGRFDRARVAHIADARIADHHEHTAGFARGECVARAAHDPVFCERYFGWAPVWGNRRRYAPPVARSVARALAAAGAHAAARRRGDVAWILRELGRWLPAALGGARPRAALERATIAWEERTATHLPRRGARRRRMVDAHGRVVRHTQLRWIAAHPDGHGAAHAKGAGVPVQALDGALAGVHALERDGERWWRWTEPVAHLRVAAPPDGEGAVLALDTGGRRGAPLDYVRGVYVGERRIRNRRLRQEGPWLLVPLPPADLRRAVREGVTILSRPLEPWRESGSPDRRRLGLPLYGVEVRPQAAAGSKP